MASDVAQRARTSAPIRLGTAVVWQPGAGYVSRANVNFVEVADITDADVENFVKVGRNRFYYTTGDADPPDPT